MRRCAVKPPVTSNAPAAMTSSEVLTTAPAVRAAAPADKPPPVTPATVPPVTPAAAPPDAPAVALAATPSPPAATAAKGGVARAAGSGTA